MDQEQLQDLKNQMTLVVNRVLQSRIELARQLGYQFGGKRDIYKVAGYKRELEFGDFDAKYRRQDIAKRVINAPADETWRETPTLEDSAKSFLDAWDQLTNVKFGSEGLDQKTIWHYFNRLDREAGVGRYALMVIGLKIPEIQDQQNPLLTPLQSNSLTGPDDLLYLSIYSEEDVKEIKWNSDPTSARYNLPESYVLKTSNHGQESKELLEVHWSRAIHFAEGLRRSEVYGTPRLEAVMNRLEDLEKVLAGGGEAAWQLLNKGLIGSAQEGKKLPASDSEAFAKIEDDIQKFIHDLSKYLLVDGLDIDVQGGEMVSINDPAMTYVSFISAATNIPQRVLMGSEQAKLASGQDAVNWAKYIMTRQSNVAEPGILRPFVNRMIYVGILPIPSNGSFDVKWPNLLTMTEQEEAEVANKRATALQKATLAATGVSMSEQEVRAFGGLPPEPEGDTLVNILDQELEELDEDDPDSSS